MTFKILIFLLSVVVSSIAIGDAESDFFARGTELARQREALEAIEPFIERLDQVAENISRGHRPYDKSLDAAAKIPELAVLAAAIREAATKQDFASQAGLENAYLSVVLKLDGAIEAWTAQAHGIISKEIKHGNGLLPLKTRLYLGIKARVLGTDLSKTPLDEVSFAYTSPERLLEIQSALDLDDSTRELLRLSLQKTGLTAVKDFFDGISNFKDIYAKVPSGRVNFLVRLPIEITQNQKDRQKADYEYASQLISLGQVQQVNDELVITFSFRTQTINGMPEIDGRDAKTISSVLSATQKLLEDNEKKSQRYQDIFEQELLRTLKLPDKPGPDGRFEKLVTLVQRRSAVGYDTFSRPVMAKDFPTEEIYKTLTMRRLHPIRELVLAIASVGVFGALMTIPTHYMKDPGLPTMIAIAGIGTFMAYRFMKKNLVPEFIREYGQTLVGRYELFLKKHFDWDPSRPAYRFLLSRVQEHYSSKLDEDPDQVLTESLEAVARVSQDLETPLPERLGAANIKSEYKMVVLSTKDAKYVSTPLKDFLLRYAIQQIQRGDRIVLFYDSEETVRMIQSYADRERNRLAEIKRYRIQKGIAGTDESDTPKEGLAALADKIPINAVVRGALPLAVGGVVGAHFPGIGPLSTQACQALLAAALPVDATSKGRDQRVEAKGGGSPVSKISKK